MSALMKTSKRKNVINSRKKDPALAGSLMSINAKGLPSAMTCGDSNIVASFHSGRFKLCLKDQIMHIEMDGSEPFTKYAQQS